MSILRTILVVEDDASIATLLIEILAEDGYTVQVAANGTDALAALQADRLDMALIDLADFGCAQARRAA